MNHLEHAGHHGRLIVSLVVVLVLGASAAAWATWTGKVVTATGQPEPNAVFNLNPDPTTAIDDYATKLYFELRDFDFSVIGQDFLPGPPVGFPPPPPGNFIGDGPPNIFITDSNGTATLPGDTWTGFGEVGLPNDCLRYAWNPPGGPFVPAKEPCPTFCATNDGGRTSVREMNQWQYLQPLPVGAFQGQSMTPPPSDMRSQWAYKKLGLPAVRPGDRLEAVTVAVIDSGLDYNHPRISRNNLWRNPAPDGDPAYPRAFFGWNFVKHSNTPWDEYGHGTFVAGLILAVNPAARIMPLKVADALGGTTTVEVSRAILFAVENGARVLNLSLGAKGISQIQQWAVDYARERGAVVVVAAGNEGLDTAGYGPAGLKGALAVGATDPNDRKPPFGNWGQQIALSAPGVEVVSVRARSTDFVLIASAGKDYTPGAGFIGTDRQLYRASGTSFAAPFVAGAASLLLARDPNLTGRQVERMLVESADDVETPGWDQFTGAGRLNIARALQADPNYFLTARVASIAPAQEGGQTVVKVSGTALGSTLDGYEIQLGQGESPSRWKTVATQKGKAVDDAVLALIPIREITARGKWAVRLLVQDAAGKAKEARGSLDVK